MSFDISSLYTRVPVEEALKIVEERLVELCSLVNDPIKEVTSLSIGGIMKLLNLAVNQCFFMWEGGLYKQKSGLPMGGRLSPILANIYMENLEYVVLCNAPILPKLYFRYVDDVFVLWDKSKGSYVPFLQQLNAQHPAIVLTEELESEHSLPFLDIRITRPSAATDTEPARPLDICLYHKPTHVDRYLHYDFSHPPMLK